MLAKSITAGTGKAAVKTAEALGKGACYTGEGLCSATGAVAAGVVSAAAFVVVKADAGEKKCQDGRAAVGRKADNARGRIDAWLAESATAEEEEEQAETEPTPAPSPKAAPTVDVPTLAGAQPV